MTATIRVVYTDRNGRIAPRDAEGTVLDAMPRDVAHTIDTAKDWARWIVNGTVWSCIARVQERRGERWHTIHTERG